MSENNIADKMSETITNVIKNSKVFEKIGKIELCISSFLLITTIVGVTSISMNIINGCKIDNIKKDIQESDIILKYQIEDGRKRNLIEHCSLKSEILIISKQMSLILENQEKLLNKLEEIAFIKKLDDHKLSINISNMDCLSSASLTNNFSPIKIPTLLDESLTNIVADDIKDQEYDELLNECYDAIPLNNLKKNTGLSWIFK
jgi:hypothetical protein